MTNNHLPSGSSLSLSLERRIDQACERFELAWQAGQRPPIEEALGDWPEAERAALLLELIALDMAYRRRAGDEPQPQEYRARFPELGADWSGPALERTVADTVAAAARAAAGEPAVPGYEVLGVLGRGGMGVVYKAWQTSLNRVVALKMIRGGDQAEPRDVARFRIEAEAVARLQHPHIVQIYEAGQHEGRLYIALECVDGTSLGRELSGTPWPARRAAQLVETLARAVQHAHRQGIVHRDLTPNNVLLTREGQPKITDFGLAKIVGGGGPTVTQTGQFMGTPSYTAPEQAACHKEVGSATDVYALGAILYECLTGRPPFKAETPLETLRQVQSQDPVAPGRLQPNVPADLETICLKCLRKEPGRRYASAEELADDLRRFQAGEPIRARPVGAVERTWKWARRRPALAALLVLTALALAGWIAGALAFAWQADQARRKEEGLRKEAAERTEQYLDGQLSVSERDLQAGRFDVAIGGLTAVLAQRPGDARASQLLLQAKVGPLLATAKANERPAQAPRALQALAQLLALDPDHAEARALKDKMTHYQYLLDCTGPDGVSAGDMRRAQQAWARRLGREVEETIELAGGVKMNFVLVPPGIFLMGSPAEEKESSAEEVLHEVTLTEPYYLGKTEVTQAQYEALMGNNPSQFKGADQPVEQVSWEDAQAYAERLTKKRDDKHLYRLPSEAEWEYSCRGGRPSSQPFGIGDGHALSSRQANFNGKSHYSRADKGPHLMATCRVGSYPANALGLFDMHGNVCEWCADCYGRYPSGAVTNPAGSTESSDRVIRGGGCFDSARYCRAADRRGHAPSYRYLSLGFRLARSVPSGKR
jgi:formylglycine-generating enzyme required for sulfatase activity